MITINEKLIIKEVLNSLLNKAKKKPSFDFRLEHESLYAWCIYQEFVNEIFIKLKLDGNYQKIEEVITFLNLESFSIKANGNLNEELEKICKYIGNIENQINL